MFTIIGIDPGLQITGYGIIKCTKKGISYINSGYIRTSKKDLAFRLQEIYVMLTEVVNQFSPNYFAIEEVFLSKNVKSALKLGQARGVAIITAANQSIPVFEYAVRKIKKTVTGTGNANKHQIQNMVKILLNLSQKIQEDAADALAIAITHYYIHQKNIIS
ncbi:crossover junction endodeoxyribonuclease RuvC [Candidatus Tachikawaea gelatinosa]|uniref:Crossover junction endodeoxyribonuclease RuvC n=1 Tax=Candidatus Tachikawaea gelatinosa TaxID=1410383 RepID=A0A090AS73_9ENTR|nr:crossover junction endodeoxyribonuclease RuvC [Candidatus Tachikawaea gelatinosa]BAP58715.1 crossover junction endodeoxyribonuclease RuvC [Candidatus Tachikawaea gelatinosa]